MCDLKRETVRERGKYDAKQNTSLDKKNNSGIFSLVTLTQTRIRIR